MKIIEDTEIINKVKKYVKEKINSAKYKSIQEPHLVIIQVGDNPYSDKTKKACEEVGINCRIYQYEESVTTEHLKSILSKLSLSPSVTAISIQLPLPEHINYRALTNEIDPTKDVDGVTAVQVGKLQLGLEPRLDPPMAKGIMKILPFFVQGKDVTIVGRCDVVGKPLAKRLLDKDATVTICHSRTENLEQHTRKSDIIILATGVQNHFGSRYFYGNNAKTIIHTGDLNIESMNSISNYSNLIEIYEVSDDLTIAALLQNICIAYDAQFDIIWRYHQYLISNEFKEVNCSGTKYDTITAI